MPTSNLPRSSRQRLVDIVQELERLEEEKAEAAAALTQAFKTARTQGFDPATLRVILKLRKLTPAERKQRRALEAIYLASLGLLDGDPLPDEARRRLDERKNPPTPPDGSGDGPAPADAPPQPDLAQPSGDTTPAPSDPAGWLGRSPQMRMALKEPEEARKEGREAAEHGKRIFDNPYPAGDPCRAAWDEGWCESSGSNGMDTPSAYQRRVEKPAEKPADGEKATDKGKAA